MEGWACSRYSQIFNDSLPLKSASETQSCKGSTPRTSQHEGLVLQWKLDLFSSFQPISSLPCSTLQASHLAYLSSPTPLLEPHPRAVSGPRRRTISQTGNWCGVLFHLCLLSTPTPRISSPALCFLFCPLATLHLFWLKRKRPLRLLASWKVYL